MNSSADQSNRPTSQLERQMSVHHECCHRCSVEHLFGNMFRCLSSGQLHCCDSTCQQRVYNDRYSTICRISKKVFYHDVILETTTARSVLDMLSRGIACETEINVAVSLFAGNGDVLLRTAHAHRSGGRWAWVFPLLLCTTMGRAW